LKAIMRAWPVLALLIAGGCAPVNLDVGYPDTAASAGPLSAVASRQIAIGPLADKRPETHRIGYKQGAFGTRLDLVTPKPVPDIVREALAVELAKNGHRVVATSTDVVLSGDVRTFWIVSQLGLLTIDLMSTVTVDLTATEAASGTVLLRRLYEGYYSERAMTAVHERWERVMATALERMIREVSTDPRFLQALRKPVN
jgi:uncharacterized lipoprotein YajG